MGYEVDFIGVGQESQSGDAILLRFGNLVSNPQTARVVLIDGGFADTATDIVEHLDKYYGTRHIDLIVSSHPDADHINGLNRLMEWTAEGELTVGELWMHRPSRWRRSIERAVTKAAGTGYARAVAKTLDAGEDLEEAAARCGVPIREPFTGLSYADSIVVVGPTVEFYQALFEEEAAAAAEESRLMKWLGAARELIHAVAEGWDIETLGNDGVTSPINNSCAIVMLREAGQNVLFTADAGMPALSLAADVLEAAGLTEDQIRLVQVPHHGSKRNVGPTVLDRLLGPRRDIDSPTAHAVVSCAKKGAPKHPAKKVTNAFRRRGRRVVATEGKGVRYHHEAPERSGWSPAEPLPLYSEVEE